MSKRWFISSAATIVVATALVALPAHSQSVESRRRSLEERLAAALDSRRLGQDIERRIVIDSLLASRMSNKIRLAAIPEIRVQLDEALGEQGQAVWFSDGSGWLGLSMEEVSAEKASAAKLPSVRGVFVTDVETDGPAAKAGLKSGDIITEFNGQAVEGTAQFRRFVRETPSGRSARLTVWRDGRSQTLTVEVGSLSSNARAPRVEVMPKDFSFAFPRIDIFAPRAPMLGISAEDLSGQLGTYFGAPDGEGVLVREVRSGSSAEKAGMKAGDVITKIDGERIRSMTDLRSTLREKREAKSVSVTVLRRGSETNLNVTIEAPPPSQERRRLSLRTSI